MAFPTNTTVLANFSTAEDPLSTGWDSTAYDGGTTNRLKSTGGQMTKNQPSSTGFGSQVYATTFGPDMECFVTCATKCADGHELLAIFLRLQTIGGSTTKGYAMVVTAAAGTDGWEIDRVTAGGTFTKINAGTITREVSAGDFIGADIINDGSGNPVVRGFHCPAASDPTVAGNWTQVLTVTDSNAAKITGTGKLALEVQGTVSRFDDLRGGTVSAGPSDQTVNPAAIAAGSQLYGPSLQPGSVTVSPAAVASGSTLYAPSLSTSVTVSPAAIASGAQLFAPTLQPGSVTVSPAAIGSGAQVYQPSTGGDITVSPATVASGSQVFAPSLSTTVTVTPSAIGVGSQLFAPSLQPGSVTVTPALLENGPSIYPPSITGGDQTAPTGFPWVPSLPRINNDDIGKAVQ